MAAGGQRKAKKPPRSQSRDVRSGSGHPDAPHMPERPAKRRRIDVSDGPPSKSSRQTPLQKLMEKAKKSQQFQLSGGKRSQVEEDEDEEIAWLEAKLGIKGTQNQWKSEYEEDGLHDLFSDLDRLEKDELFNDVEDEAPSEEESAGHPGSTQAGSPLEDAEPEWTGFPDASSMAQSSSGSSIPAQDVDLTQSPKRYVPPHLRQANATSERSATQQSIDRHKLPSDPRLRRILLGHLNKLSASNLPTILPLLEALYREHPRAIISTQLADLLLELVGTRDAIGDTFLMIYAVVVACLSRIIGKEVGALVVARAIERFDAAEPIVEGSTISARPDTKERKNIVAFITELYNCQVVACTLIYDLVRSLVDGGLEEAQVEMLLKILRACGLQLRHDDPSALKQIVLLVQDAQKHKDPKTISSRSRFMLETLTNLKNNRMKSETLSAADVSVGLKKFLANLSKQQSLPGPEPLRLTLADLRQSSSKGKWWLVGAGWGGDPLLEAQTGAEVPTLVEPAGNGSDSDLLAKLARQQGMNTDVRKKIFVALMSGEDYVDACEQIALLGLREVQQREIVRVVLHCISKEKHYNPFYALVMQQMIARSPKTAHSFQITLQYALWDILRDMGETAVGGYDRLASATESSEDTRVTQRRAQHVARAYGWWIAKGSLTLSVLKPVPFGMLQAASTDFLCRMFSTMFLSSQSATPLLLSQTSLRKDRKAVEAIFDKIKDPLARGIRHFLETDVTTSDDDFMAWATAVAIGVLDASTTSR